MLAGFMLMTACDEESGSNRRDRDDDGESRSEGTDTEGRGTSVGNTGYEAAERRAISAAGNTLNEIFDAANESFAISESATITPSGDLMSLLGLPDIGSFSLDFEAIMEGSELYLKYGLSGMGMSLTAALWMLEEQVVLHFPGLSNYYLLLADMSDYDASYLEIAEFFDNWLDFGRLEDALKGILNKTLDKYFALVGSINPSYTAAVSLGGISQSADVYEINFDGRLMFGVIEALLKAALDSPEFMEFAEEIFDFFDAIDPWMFYGYRNFAEILEEAISELEYINDNLEHFDDLPTITMNVYVSGNDVIKREFRLNDEWSDMVLSFTNLTDGSSYANGIVFAFEDRWEAFEVYFIDAGRESGGAKTGKITIGAEMYGEEFSFDIDYADVVFHDNGLFSGTVRLLIPVPSEFVNEVAGGFGSLFSDPEIRITFNAAVSGNTQTSALSLNFLGINVLEIATTSNSTVGLRIPALNVSPTSIIDINDWRAMDAFAAEVGEALLTMFIQSTASNIFGGFMDDLFGGLGMVEDVFDFMF
jgi:hypothetical protein